MPQQERCSVRLQPAFIHTSTGLLSAGPVDCSDQSSPTLWKQQLFWTQAFTPKPMLWSPGLLWPESKLLYPLLKGFKAHQDQANPPSYLKLFQLEVLQALFPKKETFTAFRLQTWTSLEAIFSLDISSPTKFLFLPHLLDNKEATKPLCTAECYFSSRPMNIVFPCQTGIFPYLPRCPDQNPRGQLFTPQLPSPTVAAYPESNSSHIPSP